MKKMNLVIDCTNEPNRLIDRSATWGVRGIWVTRVEKRLHTKSRVSRESHSNIESALSERSDEKIESARSERSDETIESARSERSDSTSNHSARV